MDLGLDDFRGEFNELAFLEKLIASVKLPAGIQPDDPAPYQAVFTKALATIESLERTVSNQIRKQSNELAETDRIHQENLAEHARSLESVIGLSYEMFSFLMTDLTHR